MRNYLMEFIGTMFLVLTIGLSGDPIAIGIVLMVMVYMGGHISGGHYNPAVTLAVWMRGKIAAGQVPGYMIAQVLGGFVAALIFFLVKGSTFAPAPGAGVAAWKAILLELLFTFAVCAVVLTVATTKKLEGNYIYGLAIGFTLLTGAMSTGPISGGALNPAVAVGPMIMDAINGGGAISSILIYLIGPLAGGALAARIYLYLNPDES
ncbi:MAG: aquaporin [bacterium]